jgi:hypothetical protein
VSLSLPDTLQAIRDLRAMGARRVRVGDVEAEWLGAPVVLDVGDAVPPDVAEVQAEADYERTLFWSAE